MGKRIDRLIERSFVTVAFFPEVPDEILGWACIEPDRLALHFAFVKREYRRVGIGTGLVSGLARCYTHQTDDVGHRFTRSIPLKFNPFLIER